MYITYIEKNRRAIKEKFHNQTEQFSFIYKNLCCMYLSRYLKNENNIGPLNYLFNV